MVCEAITCNSNCMELREKRAGQSLLFFEYCSPLCLKDEMLQTADKVLHDAVHQMRVNLHGSHLIPQQCVTVLKLLENLKDIVLIVPPDLSRWV